MANDPATTKAQGYLARLLDFSTPTIGTSTVYASQKANIELMCKVYLSLPGKGNALASSDPEKALKDLIRWHVVNGVEDIATAVEGITTAFSNYLTGGRISFIELVGEETIQTSDIMKIFQTRRDDEVREQNELVTKASGYRKQLTETADKLGISLVPAATKKAAAPAKKPVFVVKWLLKDEAKDKVNTGRLTSEIPSWQTVAILDETSEDLAKLTSIWSWIFDDKHDPEVVKNTLRNSYNTDEVELANIYARILDVLDRQLEQSRAIISNIEKDFKLYNGCLTAALELQGMLVEIGKFYGFTVGAAKVAPAKAKAK